MPVVLVNSWFSIPINYWKGIDHHMPGSWVKEVSYIVCRRPQWCIFMFGTNVTSKVQNDESTLPNGGQNTYRRWIVNSTQQCISSSCLTDRSLSNLSSVEWWRDWLIDSRDYNWVIIININNHQLFHLYSQLFMAGEVLGLLMSGVHNQSSGSCQTQVTNWKSIKPREETLVLCRPIRRQGANQWCIIDLIIKPKESSCLSHNMRMNKCTQFSLFIRWPYCVFNTINTYVQLITIFSGLRSRFVVSSQGQIVESRTLTQIHSLV